MMPPRIDNAIAHVIRSLLVAAILWQVHTTDRLRDDLVELKVELALIKQRVFLFHQLPPDPPKPNTR